MSREPQIRIKKCNDGYKFFVFPAKFYCDQPIGQSVKAYQTLNECKQELENFKTLVLRNGLCTEDGKYVKIERKKIKPSYSKSPENFYYFMYYDENGQGIFERKAGYSRRENCKKGINAVFNAINQVADI